MKLHRVELTNWRSFQGAPTTVVFDGRGTIVSGPNEDGKSTIFEAIRRGFFDRARTNAGWVGRLIPYGSNGLLPEVMIEFEHAGRRLRIHKRFGARGGSELCEQQGERWVSLAANEEGEELLLGILGARAGNQRTGSAPENWGPFQWLFVPQDLRALPAQSNATACLGMTDSGLTPEFERVRIAVQHEYEQTFTSTGRVAQQSELQRAEVELNSLRDTHRTLDAEIAEFETYRRRFEEIQAALPQVRQDATVAKTDLECIETQVADLSGLRHQLQAATERLNTAGQAAARAKEILTERLRRERACSRAAAAFDEGQAEHLRAQLELDQGREHFAAARLRATQAGDAVAELRRRFTAASQRLRIVQGKRAITALQDSLTRAIRPRLTDSRSVCPVAGNGP